MSDMKKDLRHGYVVHNGRVLETSYQRAEHEQVFITHEGNWIRLREDQVFETRDEAEEHRALTPVRALSSAFNALSARVSANEERTEKLEAALSDLSQACTFNAKALAGVSPAKQDRGEKNEE